MKCIKLMATVASAVALTFSAFAETAWFDGGIGTTWPSAATGGAWSNTDSALLVNDKIEIDATDAAPLTFAATDAKDVGSETIEKVAIDSSVKFIDHASLPAEIPAGAKAGVLVYNGKYYGVAKDGEANKWQELQGTVDLDNEVAVKVTVADSTNEGEILVTYTLNGTANDAVAVLADSGSIQNVLVTGSGSMASLSSTQQGVTYQNVTFAAPENSTLAWVKLNGEGEEITTFPIAAEIGAVYQAKFVANTGYFFANGATEVLKDVIVKQDGQQAAPEAETTLAQVKMTVSATDTYYYTIYSAASNIVDGATITVLKNIDIEDGAIFFDAGTKAITKKVTLNLNDFTVKNTQVTGKASIGYAMNVFGVELTIEGGANGQGKWFKNSDTTSMLIGSTGDKRGAIGGALTQGKVILKSGTLYRESLAPGGSSVKIEQGEFVMDGGTILPVSTATPAATLWAIDCNAAGTVTINDGVINGKIGVDEGGTVKFLNAAYSDVSANKLVAQKPNFVIAETNAIVVTSKSYTFNGDFFDVENAVANAKCTCTITGTEEEAEYTDSFDTVDAAVAATIDGKVTIVGDGTVTDASKELDVTIAEGATLTIGVTTLDNDTTIAGEGNILASSTLTVNAELDLGALTYAQTTGCTGGFSIGQYGKVIFPSDVTYPAVEGAIASAEAGAKMTVAGEDYTYDGTKWVKDGGTPQVGPGGSPVQVEAETEEEALSKVELAVTSPDETVVSSADYKAYFTVKASNVGGNSWNVWAALKDEVVKAEAETTELAAGLKDIAAGKATELSLTNAKPGLYYSVKYTDSITGIASAEEGDRAMAASDGSVTIATPKIADAKQMFYQIQVNTVDKGIVQ